MCGRYVLKQAELQALLRRLGIPDPRDFADHHNIAPTSVVPVIRRRGAEAPESARLQWGLVPGWAKDASGGARLANARAEGIAEKPSFRDAFRRRRCVVPASGFYEWQTIGGRKFPWYFTRRDGAPLLLAGIWDRWEAQAGAALETFALVTTEPNAVVAPLHDRMPVILPEERLPAWLQPEPADPVALRTLLAPLPAELMTAWPVSPRMNSVRHEGADCIEPVPAPAPTADSAPSQLGLGFD
jgi:putative SOS response-associated peptidase YedK